MQFYWLRGYLNSINASAINTARLRALLPLRLLSSGALNAVDANAGFEAPATLQQVLNWLSSPRALCCRVRSAAVGALEHIFIACLVYVAVCLVLYKLAFWLPSAAPSVGVQSFQSKMRRMLGLQSVQLPGRLQKARVLLVTAHPDDECMFFGPLIYTLTRHSGCELYLLCLSNGNYEQQSKLRREELWHACNRLGIPSSNVILVNATSMPDDPNVEWPVRNVSEWILRTVETLDIQAVLTFDRDGVSSHPNHCAIYYAAASLHLNNLMPKNCKFYTLDSINVVRKYLAIFDLLCTIIMSKHWCTLSWTQAAAIRLAMLEHRSQMKWFRWLYVYFSRYMFINSVCEVNLSDVELEMQIEDS